MAHYQITRSYPDGVDEDYRIDAFDITGLGKVSIDRAISFYRMGHTFWSGSALAPARVIVKTHPTSGRDYMTTLPDGLRHNNLASLARPCGVTNALAASYPVGGLGRLIK